jgi:hypothetical protein
MEYDGTITLSVSVTNIAASIRWFEETQGFEEIFQLPEAGWAKITSPIAGVTIDLGLSEKH